MFKNYIKNNVYLLFVFLFFCGMLFSQNRETDNWYFGTEAGVNFETPTNIDGSDIDYSPIYCLYELSKNGYDNFQFQVRVMNYITNENINIGTFTINIHETVKIRYYNKEFKYGNITWKYYQSCNLGSIQESSNLKEMKLRSSQLSTFKYEFCFKLNLNI